MNTTIAAGMGRELHILGIIILSLPIPHVFLQQTLIIILAFDATDIILTGLEAEILMME